MLQRPPSSFHQAATVISILGLVQFSFNTYCIRKACGRCYLLSICTQCRFIICNCSTSYLNIRTLEFIPYAVCMYDADQVDCICIPWVNNNDNDEDYENDFDHTWVLWIEEKLIRESQLSQFLWNGLKGQFLFCQIIIFWPMKFPPVNFGIFILNHYFELIESTE